MNKHSYKEATLGKYIELISGQHILAHHVNTVAKGVPYLTGPADFQTGYIQQTKFVEKPKTMCKKGDLLLTVKGSGVGSMVVADNGYCISRQLMALRAQRIDAGFLSYVVPNAMKDLIRRAAIGMIPGISRADILNLKILVPTMPEQKKIAAVLKTWDEAIYLTEQLIERKQKYKKALMRYLLSRTLRFKNFQGNWTKKNLGMLCAIKTGKRDANHGSDIGEYPFFTCSKETKRIADYSFDTEAILIAGNGDIGHCKYYKGKFDAYQRTYVLDRFHQIHPMFCFYTLQMDFESQAQNEAQRGAMPYIKLETLTKFSLLLPSYAEQLEIVNLITQLVNSEKAEVKKLLLFRKQKHSLLQQLLTGKLRI